MAHLQPIAYDRSDTVWLQSLTWRAFYLLEHLAFGTLPLRTQLPWCEDPEPHKEALDGYSGLQPGAPASIEATTLGVCPVHP